MRCAALVGALLAASNAASARREPPAAPPLSGNSVGTGLVINDSFVAQSKAPTDHAPSTDADETSIATSESVIAVVHALRSSADRGYYLGMEYAKAQAGVMYASLLGVIEVTAVRSGAGIGCGLGAMSKYTEFVTLRVGPYIFQQVVPPNTRVVVGDTVVTINEQSWDGITFSVTALHVQRPDLNIRLAEAVASLPSCPQAPGEPK